MPEPKSAWQNTAPMKLKRKRLIRSSKILFWSAVVTKVLATLVAVFGWYVAPIGWKLAGLVWGYSLVAFVITDLLKVLLYDLLDHTGIIFHR